MYVLIAIFLTVLDLFFCLFVFFLLFFYSLMIWWLSLVVCLGCFYLCVSAVVFCFALPMRFWYSSLYWCKLGFSSSHGWMWELDHKEGWAPKNWYFLTVVLEKTLESPLDWKEIKPVNPKGNWLWIFTGRTDAKAKTPILWPPDVKSWLLEKTLMLEKIEGKRRRGDREWDGWMASSTQWTWVWANSGR